MKATKMKNIFKSIIVVSSFIYTTSLSGFSISACENHIDNTQKSIQNHKAAEHFFANEFAFTISPITLKGEMEYNKDKITIVDVRAKKDFEAGHIKGAINVPYTDYKGFQTPLEIKEIPGLRKNGYNFVYCYDAYCNLSVLAAEKFAQLDYPVKEVIGGFQVLKEKGLPIEKGSSIEKEKSNIDK